MPIWYNLHNKIVFAMLPHQTDTCQQKVPKRRTGHAYTYTDFDLDLHKLNQIKKGL